MDNKIKWFNNRATFIESLKSQREQSKYTDATLAVNGKFYHVHKFVMSTYSDYFNDIFENTPCKSPVIVLKDIRSKDIEVILDYIYQGQVCVNQNDLTSVLKTAQDLGIKELGVQYECQTVLSETSSLINEESHLNNRPFKRRKHDSNCMPPKVVSSVPLPQNTTTIPEIPCPDNPNTEYSECTASVNSADISSILTKTECTNDIRKGIGILNEDNYNQEANTYVHRDQVIDIDQNKDHEVDIVKEEHDIESVEKNIFSEPTLQQNINQITPSAKKGESTYVIDGLDGFQEKNIESVKGETLANDVSNVSILENIEEFCDEALSDGPSAAPNFSHKDTKTIYERMQAEKKKYSQILLKVEQLSGVFALFWSPLTGEIYTHGHPVIIEQIKKDWTQLKEDPRIKESYKENIYFPLMLTKPVLQINFDEAKVFVSHLLTATQGYVKGFGDPSRKPPWYPDTVDWNTKVLTRKNPNQINMNLKDLREIVLAYYSFYDLPLPTAGVPQLVKPVKPVKHVNQCL